MNITTFIKENILLLDGATGTLLQDAGLQPGEYPERWNLTHPQNIRAIHRAYYEAGCHMICTNTFGANSLKFSSTELNDILKAAIENAKIARDSSAGTQEKFIALDIGPTGKLLKPLGDFDFEEAVAVFAETVKIGTRFGVDCIFIETMSDSYESKAALLAAKENCDLPVFVSNAYGEDGKLMTGATPAAMVALLEGMGADAVGINCSLGPRALTEVVAEYLRCASVPVLVKPNAGLPRSDAAGRTVYDVLPADFAEDVFSMIKSGVRMAGGCCGTTPAFLHALAQKTAGFAPMPITPKDCTVISSYTHAVAFGKEPVLIGERINPTGKKRFKEALITGDIDYILGEGIKQQEKGVHVLDVNVGLPEIDEADMLCRTVCELQAVCDLPLQIDTADPVAMERVLRYYNGKALINSVNGKAESMSAVFPLVKKYGGAVIALTLDENGIPKDAAGRLAIARKIVSAAATYGIEKKDIVFDPLCLTVSAEPMAAVETLLAVERIGKELGCHTSLGISNISFGLPRRDILNSTFFAEALSRGLSAAIMNPFAEDMMKVYFAYRALHGLDAQFTAFISFAETASLAAVPGTTTTPSVTAHSSSVESMNSALQDAIVRGLCRQAGELAERLLTIREPLTVIREEIIPALDIVGQGFEQKTVYLPQLLMSAEAAKSAFERIKNVMADTCGPKADKCTVVLATVKGDIHDIGKNIVKLLLENYGFPVIDLGRDVAPETVVKTVLAQKAPIAGLSALMTTTVPAMAETIRQLRVAAPACRVIVGGAVLTKEYADNIGADFYAKDAMESVRFAERVNEDLKRS